MEIQRQPVSQKEEHSAMERWGIGLADWSERWFPDAYVFAAIAVAVTCGAALLLGRSPYLIATDFGKSFWTLIPFTMQMAFVVIGGYIVAVSPPVKKTRHRPGDLPENAEGRRRLRRLRGHDGLPPELGLQPHFRRHADAGNQQTGRRRGLPGHRCRRLPRPRQHLGPRTLLLGRAPHGHQGLHPAGPLQDQRPDRPRPDPFHLAEPRHDHRAHRPVGLDLLRLLPHR